MRHSPLFRLAPAALRLLAAAPAALCLLAAAPAALCLLAAAPAALAQNEVLHYTFDAVGAAKAINYASQNGLAPAEGSFQSTDVSRHAPGRFGAGALRGSNTGGTSTFTYLDTGWPGNFSGDFSVAFWMKERVTPTTGAQYLFGNVVGGGFRCFTGGVANTGLRITGAGTSPSSFDLVLDVQSLARTRWVHVVLTVDSSRSQAVWWIDGLPQSNVALSSGANTNSSAGFRIGGQLGNSPYDLDDFRFLTRAATPLEIQSWSSSPSAADATYGSGCGAALVSTGGPPTIGNAAYALALSGLGLSPVFVSIGSSRSNLGGLPLPIDMGIFFPTLAGCGWESDFYFVIGTTADALGGATVPAPIPPDPTLRGASFYAQALYALNGAEQTSNGWASSLGF